MAAAILVPSTSHAFRTGSDLPELAGTERVRWANGVIGYRLYATGPSGVPFDFVEQGVAAALGSWSIECGGPTFTYYGPTPAPAASGDAVNTIEWVDSRWTALGFQADAAAVTDVLYEKATNGEWQIVEADLYLNGELFAWSFDASPGENERDIAAVITHEGGHMLGLLHPCEPEGLGGAPDCSADAAFAETTMYPFYSPSQATLAADDIAGACFLYPIPACETTGCAPGQVCTTKGCLAECGGIVCNPDELCTAEGCTPIDEVLGNCSADTECPPHLRCVDGKCAPGPNPAGDPCTDAIECSTSICEESHCAQPCASDDDCFSSQSCEQGTCTGLPLGEACTHAGQCIGQQCLSRGDETPVCTRRCGPEGGADSPCPKGWRCMQVTDEQVCVKRLEPDQGGCNAGPRSRGPTPIAILAAIIALTRLLIGRRRAALAARRGLLDDC